MAPKPKKPRVSLPTAPKQPGVSLPADKKLPRITLDEYARLQAGITLDEDAQQPGISFTAGPKSPRVTLLDEDDAPEPAIQIEDLDEVNEPLTEEEKLQRQLNLRLQKIAQQYKYIEMLGTSITDIQLDQAFLGQLFESLSKENTKFQGQTKTDPKHPEKYTEAQFTDFQESAIELHKTFAIKKHPENANTFQITYNNKTVDVSFEEPKTDSLSTKEISINGSQDTIGIMLLTAMHAKKKLGSSVKYCIYPSTDTEAVAELFARAEILGLNPEFKCHPSKETREEEWKQFQEQIGTPPKFNPSFQELVDKYKDQYKLNEKYKPQTGHDKSPPNKPTEPTVDAPPTIPTIKEAATKPPELDKPSLPANPTLKVKKRK